MIFFQLKCYNLHRQLIDYVNNLKCSTQKNNFEDCQFYEKKLRRIYRLCSLSKKAASYRDR